MESWREGKKRKGGGGGRGVRGKCYLLTISILNLHLVYNACVVLYLVTFCAVAGKMGDIKDDKMMVTNIKCKPL